LTAERELSPQLSQRTPSKSKAYRSPISSKDNILLASIFASCHSTSYILLPPSWPFLSFVLTLKYL
jgi:hypothetical protein